MFSYLRSHHKRSGSNPTSPVVPVSPHKPANDSTALPSPGVFEHQQHWQHEEQAAYEEDHESESESEPPVLFTPVPSLPPVLPPIPRITSVRRQTKSPTNRQSFGINFDRTSFSSERESVEERKDSGLNQDEESPVKPPTWSYGQSAQSLVLQEPIQRAYTSGSDTLSVEPVQKQPSQASSSSQASERSYGLAGQAPPTEDASRREFRLDGQISMTGAAARQAHRDFDEQQARMFQRIERPQTASNMRPHTAGALSGSKRREHPMHTQHPYSPVAYQGLQPPSVAIQQPMSATIEDSLPFPIPSPNDASMSSRNALASPQPNAPPVSPGFRSVAYDSARSRTPPTKHNAPGRPVSPQLPTVKSRTKLNLRNPMSLWLRRRSGPHTDGLQLPDEGLLLSLNNRSELPDNYDPRIKGTRVHDFNAPRPPPKRVFTSPQIGSNSTGDVAQSNNGDGERTESPRPKRAHTPTAFLEHFDDDDTVSNNQGVRAEELANSDFVQRNSQDLLGSDFKFPRPPFARKPSDGYVEPDIGDGPVSSSEAEDTVPTVPRFTKTPPVASAAMMPTPPPRDSDSIMPTPEDKLRPMQSRSPSGTTIQLTPPKSRGRASLGLPKHLDSRSSRFSFQFGGPEAHLQEKMLEERHKAKEAEKATQARLRQEDDYIDEDDYDNGYDDADMYGEEPIPGMEDDDMMDGPLSSFSLDNRTLSTNNFDNGFGQSEVFATASQLPTSDEPPKMDEENPLGTVDVVAAARMALSSNPPSPAGYSPVSLDSRSLRLPSNASGRPSMDRGRSSHEGSFRGRFESSHSGSRSRTREMLPATQEHPEGMAAQICQDEEEEQSHAPRSRIMQDLEDDMYFDDGMIEDPGEDEDNHVMRFNEDTFDDPSSQLYERRPTNEPTPGRQNFITAAGAGIAASQRASVEQAGDSTRVTSVQSSARPFSTASRTFGDTTRKSHLSDFNNLEAYHSALANAATKAAVEGRFSRKLSQTSKDEYDVDTVRHSSSSMDSEPPYRPSTLDSSGQSLTQDEFRTSKSSSYPSLGGLRSSSESGGYGDFYSTNRLGGHARISSGLGFDPNTFEFEPRVQPVTDGYEDEDDAIIAAANAEALANDDEGEYGHEFGFYAAPPPQMAHASYILRGGDASSMSDSEDGSDVEYANGGYFGPKGMNTVERTKSTREPNLTPITERSEYSTRNSYISLFGLHSSSGPGPGSNALSPGSAGPLPSPGLAQLARMSPYPSEGDEMTLENLMKLRRGAFGDGRSSISDHSAAGSSSPRNSSPVASASNYMLPRHSQLHHPSNAAAVGWLNGVAVSVGSHEGLERLGEDDESASDDENEGMTDGEVEDSDGGYDNDSPIPDSPTITGADSYRMSSSPTTLSLSDSANMYQQRNQAFHNLSLVTNSASPPSSPFQSSAFAPQTPNSTINASSPTTAHRIKGTPHAPSSPLPLPQAKLLQKDHKPQIPHSPGHSRNSSRNEEGVSVTYVREKDEENGGHRWMLERRKTNETGEVVVVGRELVTGGRI